MRAKWSALVALLLAQILAVLVSAQQLPEHPTDAELFAVRALPEPLVPFGVGVTSEADNRAMAAALSAFTVRSRSDDFSALEKFLQTNPTTPWRLAVLTNLGLLQYRAGYFARCIPSYLSAWKTGKTATEPRAKALADRAAGEYVKMLARLGRLESLQTFLAEVRGRAFVGQATELITAGLEGASMMEKHPELSYRCGPLALSRILASQHSPLATAPDLFNSRSTVDGVSLLEVAKLSAKVGLNYQVAKRAPGASLIIPSVIHWRVGHYAALTKSVGQRYLTEDPTFEDQTWHSLAALEDEASGFFLVPRGPLPTGWTTVNDDEAKLVFGKGINNGGNSKPKPDDPTTPPDTPEGCGMAYYNFRIMLASLQLTDTPVGYRPPYGYPVYFTLTYVQRDPNQPSNFNYSNLGPKWGFNWQTYIIDDPDNPASVSQVTPAGAIIDHTYSGVSDGYHTYGPQFETYKTLRRAVSALAYEVTNPDGSKEIYAQPDGSTVAPRKVFLTQRIDPAGNATTLAYDAQLRLASITDSVGQQTIFSYTVQTDMYKISAVTDPFGRSAFFTYDSAGRLAQITDVIGIQSKFTYTEGADFINSLTTPYGTTTFTTTENGSIRRLTATDPAGDAEVLETNYLFTEAIPHSETHVPQILEAPNQFNQYNTLRNSFHWNKKQWKEAANDYTKAHLYHWLHDRNFSQMSPYLESEKLPLQSRVFYFYPGQNVGLAVGASVTPSIIARSVEGGSQVTRRSHNALGKLTSETDPLGRVTSYVYSPDGVDLLSVKQGLDRSYFAANAGGSTVGLFGAIAIAANSSSYFYGNAIDVSAVSSPAPETVYQSGVFGSDFNYDYTGFIPSADCTVRLHFAETYFETAGNRVFGVQINGSDVLSSFDVFAAAGNTKNKAVVREFPVSADANGRINIRFIATVDNAIINGIEIINPSAPAPATLAAYTYDSRHLPLSSTDAAGQTTAYTYNAAGQPLKVTNAKGEVTTLAYYSEDAAGKQRKGRLATIDGPLAGTADVTSFDYDQAGRTSTVTGPDGYTLLYGYDALDRLTRTTYPDGTYTETTYLALDPHTSRDRLGRITTTVYNSIRQLASVTDPANRTIQYKWCKCGDLQQLIDAMGRVTKWRHDVAGRVTAKEYTDGSKITYAHEPLSGRLSSITDEKGQIKTYAYNLDDTLAKRGYLNEEHETPDVSYAYDADFRRLVRMTDGIGTTGYAYHPITASPVLGAGRLASVDGPWANDTITYAYDPLGRVASRAIDSVAETTTYDPAGRVGTITNALGAFTYTYDGPTARLARATHENGVAREFTYLPNAQDRRPQRIRNLKPDGTTPLSVFDYTYDVQGRITTWKQQQDNDVAGAQLWTLGYDTADQLTSNTITSGGTSVSISAWTYDAAANRTSETVDGVAATASYNALNELTGTTAALPAVTYEWDGENRLIAINQGVKRSEFSYDGRWRRVRIVEKTNGNVAATYTYVWDGLTIRERRDAMGTSTQQRYFTQGFQGVMGTPTGTHLYARDHLGSVRELVSSTGILAERVFYDAWGKASFSNTTPKTSFAYTGHFWHEASRLHMAPYRAYIATQGRWLYRDPIAERGGINLYGYVGNDPINSMDFSGLFTAGDVGGAVAGTLSGTVITAAVGYTTKNPGLAWSTGILYGFLIDKAVSDWIDTPPEPPDPNAPPLPPPPTLPPLPGEPTTPSAPTAPSGQNSPQSPCSPFEPSLPPGDYPSGPVYT